MRYFTLCLYSEGPSDRYFLEKIIWRSLFCALKNAIEPAEVQEQFIRFGKKPTGVRRKNFILSQIALLRREITMAFVHTDGGGNAANAYARSCAPAVDAINATHANICGVAVVPVKEMEAWALADQEALRRATGIRDFVLPNQYPEKIVDPKALIKELASRSRAITVASLLLDIAEQCRLSELRRLQSYQQFETDLMIQLRRMNVIP